MIRNTIRNTIQNTIRNTLGDDAFNMLNLFSGGQRGVWYDPSDLATMFQESTGGTAVTGDGQPVGLVLDKSKGGALGDELVTNGTFDTDTSGWSAYNSVISRNSNGQLVVDDSANAGIFSSAFQVLNLDVGKTYLVKFDLVSTTLDAQINIYSENASLVQYGDLLSKRTNIGEFSVNPNISFYFVPTTSIVTLALETDGTSTSVFDNVSVKEVLGTTATQPVATKRPTYKGTPDRLEIDLVDDALLFDVPTGGIDGYMVVGTNDGTASYGVSLPAGSYELGGDFFPSNTINGFLLREGAVSAADLRNIEKDFVSKGAKASYGDVTSFTNYWRNKNITEFPLIDTSSGTNFNSAWYDNKLTSFPLIDTSSGTNFNSAWAFNNLTSFPLIDTSSGTDFFAAWRNNNLTSFPLIDTSSGTIFQAAWFNNSLTSFPLIDTSSGTIFQAAWQNNNLTSFPLINTSSGTIFQGAWYGNLELADFPANMFDNCPCTNFTGAFLNTGLTQSSIDGILVSINSNGTSNGTFDQSGGSAPSSTGEAAVDAMRSRGWTVNVTGGY